MKVDLHTHSNASDGSLTPSELLQRALEKELSFFALTDHDTLEGVASILASSAYINRVKGPGQLNLITGLEISTQWRKQDIHIVGLDMDVDDADLNAMLSQQATIREARAVLIADKLEKLGLSNVLARVAEIAGGENIGRPHFARYLIEQGGHNSSGHSEGADERQQRFQVF